MGKKITRGYVEHYNTVVFTETLPSGRHIEQTYTKTPKGWLAMHSTDSAYHICPYDGVFRQCQECGADKEDFDVEFCKSKREYITGDELAARCNDCLAADVPVKFLGF